MDSVQPDQDTQYWDNTLPLNLHHFPHQPHSLALLHNIVQLASVFVYLCICVFCIRVWLIGFESASCFHFQVAVAVSPAVYRQRLLKTDGSPTKMDHNAKKQDHDDDDDVFILYLLYMDNL